jgi:hypothetical protein
VLYSTTKNGHENCDFANYLAELFHKALTTLVDFAKEVNTVLIVLHRLTNNQDQERDRLVRPL